MTLTRRSLLAAGLAVPVAAAVAGRASAALPRLTLPAPTGPYPVGVVSRPLGDLMTSVWYPATHEARRHPRAPWMTAASLHALLSGNGFDPDAAAGPLTSGREGAPMLPGRHPLILFSHGAGGHRSEATVVVQELASHGYAVATVDHPHDSYVEFPGGRVAVPDDESTTPWTHANDVIRVLDFLAKNGAGLDLHHVGMFGFSKGATATALVMNADTRVRAGLSLDGPMESQPRPAALDRPFMLMSAEAAPENPEAVEEFWELLGGWRLHVQAERSEHGAYCDHEALIPQLGRLMGWSREELESWIGKLNPVRAIRIQQAYPPAFFDQHLRGVRSRLLEGPSRAFPEVKFLS